MRTAAVAAAWNLRWSPVQMATLLATIKKNLWVWGWLGMCLALWGLMASGAFRPFAQG